MDSTLVTELIKLGILGIAVVWFARRDDRNQEAAARREEANQKRADEREAAERVRCDTNITALAGRLDAANDRHNDEQRELLRGCMKVIEENSTTFSRLIEERRSESGAHRTQQGGHATR